MSKAQMIIPKVIVTCMICYCLQICSKAVLKACSLIVSHTAVAPKVMHCIFFIGISKHKVEHQF